jgi:hypothetical protein
MQVKHLMRAVAICLGLSIAAGDVPLADAQSAECRRRGRTYPVRIDSAPQQAAVYVGSKKCGVVGYTPWNGRLPQGQHSIIVQKQGYADKTQVVNVRRLRRRQETFIVMEVGKGTIDVQAGSNAEGASISISGQRVGAVPFKYEAAPGRYLVAIEKEGFSRFERWVDVKAGQAVPIRVELSKRAGSILVEADVRDAEIYLDGNKVSATTPAVINDVTAGPHVVEVRKAPALPWRQTVEVRAGETIKVSASLEASMAGAGGNVKIVSNVSGANVLLDGKKVGVTPMTIKAVKAGNHIIAVAKRGYETNEEQVDIQVGQALVLKMNLRKAVPSATIKVIVGVPGAEIYVDGNKVDPKKREVAVAPGEHFVTVTKQGYAKYEKKVTVAKDQTLPLTVELKAMGGLRFLSTPSGADVILDSKPIGTTPMVNEVIPAGEHIVTIRLQGYYDYEEPMNVEGGEMKVVRAQLQKIETGPTEAELRRTQKGLTSYGARVLPPGSSTIDFGFGYPYFFEGKITVGAYELANKYGLDAGVLVRTFLSRTELGLTGRLTLVDKNPFSFGVWTNLGGGSNFIDESGRNTYFFDLGGAASLTGLGSVTITGRAYLQMWTDRHCPAKENGQFITNDIDDVLDICIKVDNNEMLDEVEERTIRNTVGDNFDDILDRENGVRVMASLLAEVAIRQRWNVWILFEGSPLRRERAAFSDVFNAPQLEQDIESYIRLGATWKFSGM